MTTDLEPVGTIITDIEQRILHIDDRYGEIVGRARCSLIGTQALSFTHVDDLPVNQRALNRLAVNGPGFTIVKRYVRGDGNLVWVKNHVTRITDGAGSPVICATTQPIDRPFESERLTRNYKTAQRLCSAFMIGRRRITPEVVWAPAIETLLWLYCAEVEGRSLNTEELASLIGNATSVMVRWVKLLEQHDLVVAEQSGPLVGQKCIRISAKGERKVDKLLSTIGGKHLI